MIKLKDFVECVNCDVIINVYNPNQLKPILIVNGNCSTDELENYGNYIVDAIEIEYEDFACYLAEEQYQISQIESNLTYEYFTEKTFYELFNENIKIEYKMRKQYLGNVTFDQYKEDAMQTLNKDSETRVNQLSFKIINKGVK